MKSKERIGNFINLYEVRNTEKKDYPVVGINKDKTFMPTVANLEGVDTSKYKVVSKGIFVFSGMQTGRDVCIRIGLYTDVTPALVSPAYTTFAVDTERVLPEYFFMFFNRDESDRYGWFISDSSVRANLDWPRFLDIEIPLPPPEEQQKVVNAWKSCKEIKEQNEAKAAPLMQLCQSYIQELKHKYPAQEIGPYIEERKEFNSKNKFGESDAKGVNTNKEIQECKRIGDKLNTYKIVYNNDIVFNANIKLTQTSEKFAVGLYKSNKPCIVTNFYTVMSCADNLIPEYLLLWLSRDEFARYVRFMSCSSVRDRFSFNEMKNVSLPIPPIEVQRAIVNIYKCANEAKQIADEADKLSRAVCPALIQHVINS